VVAFGLSTTLSDLPTGDSAVDRLSIGSVWRVLRGLRRPTILRVTAVLVVGNVVWQACTGFYSTYLVEAKGFSTPVAAGLFGLFFALGSGAKLLAGGPYDRVGVRRTLVVVLSTAGVAFTVLPFLDGFWPVVGATVLASAFLGYGTVVHSYLTEAIPSVIQGTGLGVLRTTYLLTGAPSPALIGAAASRGTSMRPSCCWRGSSP
jgi:MFS family permease